MPLSNSLHISPGFQWKLTSLLFPFLLGLLSLSCLSMCLYFDMWFIHFCVCLSLNTRIRGIHCKLPLMLILCLYLLLVKILSSYSHVGNKAGSTHCMWFTAMLPTGWLLHFSEVLLSSVCMSSIYQCYLLILKKSENDLCCLDLFKEHIYYVLLSKWDIVSLLLTSAE